VAILFPYLGYLGGLVVHHVLACLEAYLLSTYSEAFHHVVACLVAFHRVAYWGSFHLSFEVDHHLLCLWDPQPGWQFFCLPWPEL